MEEQQRDAARLRGAGPQAVVTDLGVMEPDENGELILTALHPGKTVEQVKENTGWDVGVAPKLVRTETPSDKELHILRTELDPDRIYLK